ncbi:MULTISPECIES: methyltransferase domain-containing protein [unclassified Corynebacterium]|uniref:methyltransferase domain-containing protein n=1 Tax=Corynebacterium TaxID=1716 RepID=UPI00254EAE28|nr:MULTISPECIES: methyltransferase domain-containing protein [unclassified Corynebacterium]MDK8467617.1 methyltransferase domain-containing protein [Corynebacterium sp. MSK130]MDK8475612.1 methyltransferase domain-containing protein [Corynebacterium sp. MSK310]MDK8491269.1 methyltransferase domain-containing protein [Corynebacterium sp. MSK175]MDK8672081.1 methyltransferase domain-containing protein [Corynebacterium sp. MSK189]MDK8688124.1 methyltransferase domain-containing protein [Corynebac
MLSHIVDILADPNDGTALSGAGDFSRLVSESGHSFDVAKQGYVTLAAGAGLKHKGDDMDMVNAREAYLATGHFAPFVESVTGAVQDALDASSLSVSTPASLLEVGAGTGYYLAHTLDSIDGARGVGLDISPHAAKHLAKCHPRVGAVVADVWQQLPIRDESIDAISVVFAPRNPSEFQRVLAPGGQVIVLTPGAGHLDELREPLGILGVEEGKVDRMYEQAEGHLEQAADPVDISFPIQLDKAAIAAQVGMSPSARHISADELAERMAALPPTLTVTARARLDRLRAVS